MYYSKVWGPTFTTLHNVISEASSTPDDFLYVRWIYVWKMAQNLVLKFGGGPVVLAWIGLREREAPAALRWLLRAWFACGIIQAGIAVLTTVALRFEFFLTPAVAMAAGVGAARLQERGRGRTVAAIWGLSLIVQVLIAVSHLFGPFGWRASSSRPHSGIGRSDGEGGALRPAILLRSHEAEGRADAERAPPTGRGSPSNHPRVATQKRHTESITGTSTSTPTTVARAAPEAGPYSAMAVATASSKKLEAPIRASGAATA